MTRPDAARARACAATRVGRARARAALRAWRRTPRGCLEAKGAFGFDLAGGAVFFGRTDGRPVSAYGTGKKGGEGPGDHLPYVEL
jgi:hypothetical protein